MKKILITGSSGMIGKNLFSLLKNKDRYLTPSSRELDLMNKLSVKKFISKNKIGAVLHLAAKVGGIQANINNNFEFFLNNTIMNINLISECYNAKIPKFLNVASTCIYPSNINKKIKENMLLDGKLEKTNEGYALSKINAIKLCEYINKKNKNLSYKTVIPCNMYGLFDNFDPASSHLIPGIINKIVTAKKNNQREVVIWGKGNAKREFMYAEDFAKILVKIMNRFEKIPEILNIGTGKDYKIKDYYKLTAKLLSWEGSWKYDITKPEGMKRKLADTSFQKKLNLMPETNLEKGISETINYYINRINEK